MSGVALAALAVTAVVVGGWPFVVFWTLAAIGVYWEWSGMTEGDAMAARIAGFASLGICGIAAGFSQFWVALTMLGIGLVTVIAIDRSRLRSWRGAGVAYAGIVLLAPVLLRRDPERGVVAILFLFAVVWSTDVLAYFVGRGVGGPRLAPAISPNKTWSGALGGVLGAVIASVCVAALDRGLGLGSAAAVALGLSVFSQAGDLFESAIKRRFGVKDASHVIPGHGGLMDRLDGFIAASAVAALVGVMRGGFDAPARGFLLW